MYRVIISNTQTGKRMIAQPTFTSKKKAEEWAESFKMSMRNSDAMVVDSKKMGALSPRREGYERH